MTHDSESRRSLLERGRGEEAWINEQTSELKSTAIIQLNISMLDETRNETIQKTFEGECSIPKGEGEMS